MAPSRASKAPSAGLASSSTAPQYDAKPILPPSVAVNDISDDEDEEDPVISTFDVYITAPSSSAGTNTTTTTIAPTTTAAEESGTAEPSPTSTSKTTSVYLLQYPTRIRQQPYTNASAPTALRLKPTAGFIEVDVPNNLSAGAFDAAKARTWGRAMERAESATGKGGTGYGVANGFVGEGTGGAGTGTARRKRPGRGEGSGSDIEMGDEDGDHKRSRVLETQTLGGLVTKGGKGSPNYMLGTFRGPELHLTPITALAQLRPQHTHIDALSTQSRTDARLATTTTSAPPARSLSRRAPGKESTVPAPAPARAKMATAPLPQNRSGTGVAAQGRGPGVGGGGAGVNKTHSYPRDARVALARAGEEPWRHLSYVHEECVESYEVFNDEFFLDTERVRAGRRVGEAGEGELVGVWPKHLGLGGGAGTGGGKGGERERGWLDVVGSAAGAGGGKARVKRRRKRGVRVKMEGEAGGEGGGKDKGTGKAKATTATTTTTNGTGTETIEISSGVETSESSESDTDVA